MKVYVVVYVAGGDDPQVVVFVSQREASQYRDFIFSEDGDSADVTIHECEVKGAP